MFLFTFLKIYLGGGRCLGGAWVGCQLRTAFRSGPDLGVWDRALSSGSLSCSESAPAPLMGSLRINQSTIKSSKTGRRLASPSPDLSRCLLVLLLKMRRKNTLLCSALLGTGRSCSQTFSPPPPCRLGTDRGARGSPRRRPGPRSGPQLCPSPLQLTGLCFHGRPAPTNLNLNF